jgi:hypothetical protein
MTHLVLDGWLTPVLLLLIAWSLTWQGMGLWRAAQRGERVWFVVFLLVHTLGPLEIIYLFAIAPRPRQS